MDIKTQLNFDSVDQSTMDDFMEFGNELCTKISTNQLKTQSRVTSFYGYNMEGAHQEIEGSTIDIDEYMGRELVIRKYKENLNIVGIDAGGLVFANINKAPPPKMVYNHTTREKTVIKKYKLNRPHRVMINIDAKITSLVITNCYDIIFSLSDKVKTSIEIINSNDIVLKLNGFNFFRSVTSDNIKINDVIDEHTVFDIRKSSHIFINDVDMFCSPFGENRYHYVDGMMIILRGNEDIFNIKGSRSFPSIMMIKKY